MGLVDRLVEHWMVQNSVHPVNTIVREQQEAIVGSWMCICFSHAATQQCELTMVLTPEDKSSHNHPHLHTTSSTP